MIHRQESSLERSPAINPAITASNLHRTYIELASTECKSTFPDRSRAPIWRKRPAIRPKRISVAHAIFNRKYWFNKERASIRAALDAIASYSRRDGDSVYLCCL